MSRTLLIAFVGLLFPVAVSGQNLQRSAPVLSPESQTDGKVTFRLRAAQAKEASLRGQWNRQPLAMTRGEDGIWSVTAEGVPPGVWEYSFQVYGLNVLDSLNPTFKPQREPSKSILHIPGVPANAWDWQDVPHGTVHQHAYDSKALGKRRELWVYTPPGYEKAGQTANYPLFVLQHGSGDNHQTWVVHGKANWILDNLIAAGKTKPMVVVMLDGHPLGQFSRGAAPQRRGAAIEAFRNELFDDALPLVESLYRVHREPQNRAIAGLSMGGGQSLTVGLGNLDRFAWVGAFSAAPPSQEIAQAVLAEPATTNAKLNLLWIGCGEDDSLKSRNEEFVAALKDKAVRHEWHLTAGDHSWPVWRQYLAEFTPKLFQEPAK
jgi:enterochelin esterase family protein